MENKKSKANMFNFFIIPVKLKLSIHILVIISTIGSMFSSFVDPVSAQTFYDDPEQAIASIANEPFNQSPVTNRRSAYELLIQITEYSSDSKHSLPAEMTDKLLSDNEAFFVDEGRFSDQQVLTHDWELAKLLVKIIRDKKAGESNSDLALDGLLFLLRADKHIAALAIQDASFTINSCEGPNPPKKSECNKANAHLNTANIRYQNGIDALTRGDADSAVNHFQKSWSFSNKILALWGIAYEGDLDGDGLINLLELRLGSDIFAPDSDGDGLSDSFEFFKLFPYCLTTQADTDQNGTLDGLEDLDDDGLTNHQESDHGTMPLRADTDGDTLGDLFEIQTTGVNPLLADSDLDGLNDDSELRLGSDPASPDTDSDGIPDSDEIYAQVLQNLDIGIIIEIEGIGDSSTSFQAHSLAGVAGLDDLPGLIGDFISFSAEAAAGGSVRLRFDPSQVPNQDFTNLRIVSYNPGTGELSILPDQAMNLVASEVIASFDSYSPVAIVYIPYSSLSSLGFDGFAGRSATQNETQRVILTSRPIASLSFPTILNIDYQQENNDPTPTPDPTQLPDVIPTPTPAEEIEGIKEESDSGEDPPIKIPLVEMEDDFPALSSQMESFAKSADVEKIIIGDAAEIEHSPAVVYNPNTQRYLVVWVKDTNPAGIYGRYLTEEGQPDGAAFLLANESVDTPSRLELQYNSVENTYLLAWQELNGQTSVESYYYGQIVYTIPKANLYTLLINSEGEPIGTAPNLITSELTDLDGRFEFDIVFNSTNNQYLIAWVQPRGQIIYRVVHPHRLIAQVLDANGIPSGNQQVIQPGAASDVRLEYSPESHKYLLTYSYFYPSNIEYEVSGLLLNADTLTISRYIPLTNMRTGWQMLPQLTYNPIDDVFFGSWYDSPEYSTGGVIHFRSQIFQASNGLQVGESFVVMESTEGIFSEMPGAGYSQIEDRYLVLGAYGGFPTLQGQYVLPDRSLDGDPFLLDDSAIQNSLAARLGEGEELPTWLSVWTHKGDIHGQVLSGAPAGDRDSDLDGLTDAEEIAGFVNQFGKVIKTSPDRADTDADGIPDGDEIGLKSGDVHQMISDPTLPDTDFDEVEDFVEIYALPYPTSPRDPDTDGDGLNDGEEVNIYSTDPLSMDTDGDGQNDGEEIANDSDPLLFDTIISPLDTFSQFSIGAVCGDFCIDNPDNGTIPFLIGLVVSGAISVIPLGATQVIGGLADARDFIAALIRKDPAGIILIGLTLIPYLGDPADFIGTVGRFVGRYPKLAGEAAVVLTRLDFVWKNLDEAGQLKIMKKFWSDEVIESLLTKDFSISRIVDLVYSGVDLRHLASALEEVVDHYPGLIKFLKEIPLDGQGILKGNGLTANLKGLANAEKLGNARSLSSYLSNIKGAYTQVVMKTDRFWEGIEIIQDLRHVNAGGYDLILKEGALYKVLEAKSGASLAVDTIKNYIYKLGDARYVDIDYFTKQFAKLYPDDPDLIKTILRSGQIEIEIFINNPRSAEIAAKLLSDLGGSTAKYFDDKTVEHTINIIISAVSK